MDLCQYLRQKFPNELIFSGVFTIISYVKAKAQSNLMKICLVVNSLYAAFSVAAFGMMVLPKIM